MDLKKHIDLTIVIPTYNSEKYIGNTLDSLINGVTEYAVEIIVIDDNSNDKTLQCISSKKNFNLKIIENDINRGVAYSRNLGIKNASGRYIAFLDSDDTVQEKMYDKMLRVAYEEFANIVVVNYNEVINNNIYKSKYKYNLNANEDLISKYLKDEISMAVWDKIYEVDWLKKNKVFFNENVTIGEDVLFVLECFVKKPLVLFKDEYLYNYFQRKNSTMHIIRDSMIALADLPMLVPDSTLVFLKENYNSEYLHFKRIEKLKALHAISRCTKNSYKERKCAIKKIMNNTIINDILNDKKISKFLRFEMLILKIFGVYGHLMLFPLYDSLKKIMRRKNEQKRIETDY